MELSAITVVVVGGTLLTVARATVVGTLFGVLDLRHDRDHLRVSRRAQLVVDADRERRLAAAGVPACCSERSSGPPDVIGRQNVHTYRVTA